MPRPEPELLIADDTIHQEPYTGQGESLEDLRDCWQERFQAVGSRKRGRLLGILGMFSSAVKLVAMSDGLENFYP